MIYALCDRDLLISRDINLYKYVKICIEKDVSVIQYRDKTSTKEEKKCALLELRALWSGTLIVNDDIELVHYCDGIHLGQEDLSQIDTNHKVAISKIREHIGNKIIGISTHNENEILKANELDIDYIGLGAYRDTSTKSDISTILGDDLSRLAKLSTHKVGAIGGVRLDDKIDNVTYYVIGSGLL